MKRGILVFFILPLLLMLQSACVGRNSVFPSIFYDSMDELEKAADFEIAFPDMEPYLNEDGYNILYSLRTNVIDKGYGHYAELIKMGYLIKVNNKKIDALGFPEHEGFASLVYEALLTKYSDDIGLKMEQFPLLLSQEGTVKDGSDIWYGLYREGTKYAVKGNDNTQDTGINREFSDIKKTKNQRKIFQIYRNIFFAKTTYHDAQYSVTIYYPSTDDSIRFEQFCLDIANDYFSRLL